MPHSKLPASEMSASEPELFVPYAPVHRQRPVGQIEQLLVMARNPIENWTRASFDLPISSGPSLLGHIVVVSTPAGVRRVFVDNAANYEKDPLQMRVLRAGAPGNAGEGLLIAKGDLWKRLRRTLAPLFTPRRVEAQARVMQQRADARVERWFKRRAGSLLEIDREMTGLTYDILSATLFSDEISANAADTERELMALLDAMGRISPLDALNMPSWIPRPGRARMRATREWFGRNMAALIEARRKSG